MPKPLLACVVLALAATGCKKKSPSPPPPTAPDDDAGSAAPVDAEVALPDEDILRAGKRTGLGGPDETPEVATEDLARALIAGNAAWSRLVSPSSGVVELRPGTLRRHCGADVDAALTTLAASMADKLAHPELGLELSCDNSGLVGPAPRSALCSIDGPDLGYDLVFVPDPTLGLRLVGYTVVDGGAVPDGEMDAFGLELAKGGELCP